MEVLLKGQPILEPHLRQKCSHIVEFGKVHLDPSFGIKIYNRPAYYQDHRSTDDDRMEIHFVNIICDSILIIAQISSLTKMFIICLKNFKLTLV